MGSLMIYCIKGAVALAVMFSVYLLVMRRLKCLYVRRLTINMINMLALLMPMISFVVAEEYDMSGDSGMQMGTADIGLEFDLSAYQILSALAIAGIFVMVLYTLIGVSAILYYRFWGRSEKVADVRVTVVGRKGMSPFCFGNRLFMSEDDFNSMSAIVFTHETSHLRHRHFIDLLIGRAVIILQWWNPFSLFMLKELRVIHEYQADDDVIKSGFDRKEYQYLLLEKAVGKHVLALGNFFARSALKNRFIMMNRRDGNQVRRLLAFLILPSAIISLNLFSVPVIAGIIDPFGWIEVENLFFRHEGKYSSAASKIIYLNNISQESNLPAVMVDGVQIDYQEMLKLDPNNIERISVIKNGEEYPEGLIKIELRSDYDKESDSSDKTSK